MRPFLKAAAACLACLPMGCDWGGVAKDIGYQVGEHMLGSERGMLFYAYDTLAYPGEPVDLVARLQSAREMPGSSGLKGLGGAVLGFYRDGERIGQAETDDDGHARIAWTPPRKGDYAFEVRILEPPRKEEYEHAPELEPAPLLVSARKRDAELAIVDLDHTVVDSGFFRVLMGGARPMSGAAPVLDQIDDRYTLVYLTQRPNILTRKSKQWLAEHDFPRGVLLLSELKDVFDSGKFKTARIKSLRESYPNVALGIGDKLSDAQAYVDNGMQAYLIPRYDRDDAEDVEKMAREVRRLKGRGRLHVVDDWSQIDSGVFQRRSYPPDRYARGLELRANTLRAEKRAREREERRREKSEDDEDDDDEDDDEEDD